MQSEFSETYKRLSNEKLLEIIENKKDYNPLAIETAKHELNSRQLSNAEIESAQKNNANRKEAEHKKQQSVDIPAKKIKEHGGRLFDIFNPIGKKTAENIITIISILLFIFFIYKLIRDFSYISYMFNGMPEWDSPTYFFLLELIYIPVMLFLFSIRSGLGRKMMIVWLSYSFIGDFINFNIYYQYTGIDDSFLLYTSRPSLPGITFVFLFHAALMYFLLKKDTRQLFKKPEIINNEPSDDSNNIPSR